MALAVHVIELPYQTSPADFQALLSPEIVLTWGEAVKEDCEILVAGRPSEEQLLASSKLRALVIPWAGVPQATRTLVADFPHLGVHNLHYNALPVAELAVTLLLTAAKRILPMDRALRAHDWTPRYQRDLSLLLSDSQVLILGYGSIGKLVARFCQGLGMRVAAIKGQVSPAGRQLAAAVGVTLHPTDALDRCLPESDALIICLPLTPATERLLGARELALLPAHAVLVNVSRAAVVDEAALYQALRDQRLLAAALDVWYQEPQRDADLSRCPPAHYPFEALDNVVMSPHRAAHARSSEQLRLAHLADLLNAAARDGVIPNQVDRQAGY